MWTGFYSIFKFILKQVGNSYFLMILSFCEPLIDAIINVDKEMMHQWGLDKEQSLLVNETFQPLINWALNQENCIKTSGGTGQNTICMAQWMFGKENKTAMIGSIGNDPNGQILKNILDNYNVKYLFQEIDGKTTGCVIVFLWEKKRSFIASLGASGMYNFNEWDSKEVLNCLNSTKAIYTSAFFLRHSDKVALSLAAECAQRGITYSLGLSSSNLIDSQIWGSLRILLRYINIIFGNEDEFISLGKKLNFIKEEKLTTSELLVLAQKISNYGNPIKNRIIIMTMAEKPTIVCETGSEPFLYDVIPINNEEIVDTNGAGDSYAGGFLSQFILNKPLKECLEAGAYAAWCNLKERGCTIPSYPSKYSLF